MSSAVSFGLDRSGILSFGNGLNNNFNWQMYIEICDNLCILHLLAEKNKMLWMCSLLIPEFNKSYSLSFSTSKSLTKKKAKNSLSLDWLLMQPDPGLHCTWLLVN